MPFIKQRLYSCPALPLVATTILVWLKCFIKIYHLLFVEPTSPMQLLHWLWPCLFWDFIENRLQPTSTLSQYFRMVIDQIICTVSCDLLINWLWQPNLLLNFTDNQSHVPGTCPSLPYESQENISKCHFDWMFLWSMPHTLLPHTLLKNIPYYCYFKSKWIKK